MLKEFRVKDFALVDELSVRLGEGLNIITGETGSGKSVLVGALTLLLGKKADSSMVRKGAGFALVEGVFEWNPPSPVLAMLEEAGVAPEEDSSLIISREIHTSGRSSIRINSRAVPASLLKEVGAALADIHGQHQHQALMRDANHILFVDLLGSKKQHDLIADYSARRSALAELLRLRKETETGRDAALAERDMLLFRVKEIEEAVSSDEECEELRQEVSKLENAEKLASAAAAAWEEVARSGKDASALNGIAAALAALEDVEGFMPELDAARGLLLEADSLIENAARDLREIAEGLEADPARLAQVQDLLLETQALLKKNKCATVAELIEFSERSRERIKQIEDTTLNIDKLEKNITTQAAELDRVAAELTSERKKTAASMQKQISEELAALGMPDAKFVARFTSRAAENGLLPPGGAETVEFMISANAGEDPMPISRVASGGELSRIMLAFKTVLSKRDPVAILVFDEIDSGIGGMTAHNIGGKLQSLAEQRQVITITHLPQIAALKGSHIAVSKSASNGRTVVNATVVDGDARLREICRMLGDSGTKNATIEMARQLMKGAGGNGAKPTKKAAAK